jgi:hypothetical protein
MPAQETSFTKLANVPVHYDRLPAPDDYGSEGKPRTFRCTIKLRDTLEQSLTDLFTVWGRGRPSIILTAGTIGDGDNAHGQGLAFDLDGFHWDGHRFMMDEYPADRRFYVGINAHLFLYFSQVLSYHYPAHRDHFHVDFNFDYTFRPASNAQTFFLQSALKYLFDKDIGGTGPEHDGVDGVYGSATEPVVTKVLQEIGLSGEITTKTVWREFLLECRKRAFA